MRIDHLKVQNFRCFEQAEFNFSPRFNLLVGVNGAGKTSLLKAVVAALATPRIGTQQGGSWLHEEESAARLALVELQGRARFERCYPVLLDVTANVCGLPRSWWMTKDGPASQVGFEHTIFPVLAEEAAKIVQGAQGALPVAAFYSAERQWRLTGVGADTAVRQQDARLDGYRSWSNAALDMKGLESWVIAKSLERLEAVSSAGVVLSGGPLDELTLVNRAVAQAVPGSTGLHYDIKYRRLVLGWKDAAPVPFENLSDGQRTLTALVADIARRMCLLNPQLGDKVLEETPGVVVIDELDMHLHPTWQRRISGLLMNTFPLVQFFAASHSPQIIGELAPEHIWLMRGGKVLGHPERSLGLDSGEVLEELMGSQARNPDVEEELRLIRRAIDNDALVQAQVLLDTLKARVGEIPDVQQAQSAIDSLNWLEDDPA